MITVLLIGLMKHELIYLFINLYPETVYLQEKQKYSTIDGALIYRNSSEKPLHKSKITTTNALFS